MLFLFWLGYRDSDSRGTKPLGRRGSDSLVKGCHSLPLRSNPNFMRENKNSTPKRCCFVLYRAAEKDIAFKSVRHYRIHAIFGFATQPAPTLSMTAIILAVYFFNLRLIPYIPTMPFQKTILCYNSIGSRHRLTILVLAEVQLWK